MRYASLDIETTGLSRLTCGILQIAVVVDDLQDIRSVAKPVESLPTFKRFIALGSLNFEPYALGMHMKSGLLNDYLADTTKKSFIQTLIDLDAFLKEHYPLGPKEKYNFAGKNLQGFDLPFIQQKHVETMVMNPIEFLNKISHKVIDPAVFFTDLFYDKSPASLDQCKERAGLEGGVTHDALDDCRDVINLVRHIALHNKDVFKPE